MSLLDCRSEEEYDILLDLFISITTYRPLGNLLLTSLEHESVDVQNWAIQKKSAVIRAGLNKSCSKIQPYYFDILRNHINAVEQSHQKSYASGKYLTLVEAVKK